MKKMILVPICILVLAILLLSGCSKSAVNKVPEKYEGFMELKAGQWTESTVKEGTKELSVRTEVIENSPIVALFQFSIEKNGLTSISQVWYNTESKTVDKYVAKSDDGIECLSPADAPEKWIPGLGSNYLAGKDVELVKFDTKAGQSVTAAKFTTTSGEVLVSSEVPFGMVTVVDKGKTVMSLDDFGTIGAKSKISDDELAECDGEAATGSTVTNDYESTSAADASYGQNSVDAIESDSKQPEDPLEGVTYSSIAYEKGTGENVSFNCAKCDEMPAMARTSCLASCN